MAAVRGNCDVVVLGGGLAGLTLALQLARDRPSLRVVVVDKREHPAPEAAFKVGESFVEVGSWYLREVLGLREHLLEEQLPKFGLRFFMSSGDNRDIARRTEFGPLSASPFPVELPFRGLHLPTYNVDRGRLENYLVGRAVECGVDFVPGARVSAIELGADAHDVELTQGRERFRVRGRWLVDATGRAGLLKRRLGLEQVIDHDVDARWFRVDRAIDVEDWSSELAWRSRTIPGLRRYSTNHLMGHGYWVWLIPLASGGTSVGLVTDARVHDRAALNRFDRVLAWLAQCEPQCAEALAGDGCELQDFKVMYGGAHGCRRVISPDRWAITGEAGVHLDPLYSPGGDFIAVSNTLIAQIIGDDLDGRSIAGTVHFGETVVQSMFEQYLSLYRGQYPVMGSPRVMTAKVCWDTAVYFGYNTLLFQNGRLCDRRFLVRARGEIEALRRLQARVQSAFPAWAARDRDECAGGFVDQLAVSFMRDLYLASTPPYTDDDLHARLRVNIDTLEQVAAQMLQRATARDSPRAAAPAIEADVGLLWA